MKPALSFVRFPMPIIQLEAYGSTTERIFLFCDIDRLQIEFVITSAQTRNPVAPDFKHLTIEGIRLEPL